MSSIADIISRASPVYLFMEVSYVIFFTWTESAILHYLSATLGIKTERRTCFPYPFVGFSFSRITPSTGGGRPAQVYYMRKNMIPVPVTTVVLVVIITTYKLMLVVIGCLLTISGQSFLNRYLYEVMLVYYLRLGLNVAFYATLLILAFHTSPARDMVMRLLGLLERFHLLRKKTFRVEHLLLTMEHYNDMAAFLRQHKHALLGVLFLTSCQWLTLSSVTYFVYRAFELKGTAMLALVLLQSTISVSANMLLLPGDVRISEHLLLTIFDSTFYGDLPLPAMVLSGGITYYVQLGFNVMVIMYTRLTLVKKRRKT